MNCRLGALSASMRLNPVVGVVSVQMRKAVTEESLLPKSSVKE